MKLCRAILACGVFCLLALFILTPTFLGQGTESASAEPFTQNASQSNAISNSTVSERLEPGILVEKVEKNFEGERAGLQEGDVLLSWRRADFKGELTSPFDLSQIEIEQAPRGNVTLEGLRDTEKKVWIMGPDAWRIQTRPILPGDLLSLYLNGQKLADTGEAIEAAEHWQAVTAEAQKYPSPWLQTWMFFHSAQRLAEARQWKQADEFHDEAARRSAKIGPAVAVQVLRAWAATFQLRSDWGNAIKYYDQAIAECQKLGTHNLMEAATLGSLGTIARTRGDQTKAEEYYRRAFEIQKQLAPNSLDVASSLNSLGIIAEIRGDMKKEEDYLREALLIREKLAPGSLPFAQSLNQLGDMYWALGDPTKADEYFHRAFAIRQKLAPHSLDYAISLNNLGIVASERSDLREAENYYRRALEIQEEVEPGSFDVARSLHNLAVIAQNHNDMALAVDYFRRALEICEKVAPDNDMVPLALDNLGEVFRSRGDLARAHEYHQRALVVAQKISPNNFYVGASLHTLGRDAEAAGDLAKAEEYYRRALAIYYKLSADGYYYYAGVLNNLGGLAAKRSDLAGAEKDYLQALASYKKVSPNSLNVATELNNLGDLARRRDDAIRAEEYYREALAIREKLVPQSMDHAETLAALAEIKLREKQTDAAASLFEQALNALESQVNRLGGTEEIQSNFRAQRADYYKDFIELLIRQQKPELAFQVLERSRAQTFLEILSSSHMDIRKGVAPDLMESERSLEQSLNAKLERRIELLNDKHTEEQVAIFDREIKDLLGQYQDVEERIRVNSPVYAALTQPQSLNAKHVQRQLLDSGTLLLEYSLGEERSYVFTATPDTLNVYELPKRTEIERAASRVYKLLTIRNSVVKSKQVLQRHAHWGVLEKEYSQAVAQLSRMVLGPLAAQLQAKRLLIVSDGALQYIPFAILPAPSNPDSSTSVPLIADHEIVNLPSASVLAVLREEELNRKHASKTVAVLADPVFAAKDDRVQLASHNGAPGNPLGKGTSSASTAPKAAALDLLSDGLNDLDRSARDLGIQGDGLFPRLPFTRREADAIQSVAEPGNITEALDFDASKATALSSQLKDYRIVHFATHGLLNNDHPELSGLVLSLVDKNGNQQDGFLRMIDIYNMDLNADLVVLSACQTALGKEIGEEGLIGLTRGFMYAGAPRVVASLWKVDDEATAELMKQFYEGMLRDHQTPAQALRSAQQWMRAQKQWQAPYYWAGFVLQGEWR